MKTNYVIHILNNRLNCDNSVFNFLDIIRHVWFPHWSKASYLHYSRDTQYDHYCILRFKTIFSSWSPLSRSRTPLRQQNFNASVKNYKVATTSCVTNLILNIKVEILHVISADEMPKFSINQITAITTNKQILQTIFSPKNNLFQRWAQVDSKYHPVTN